MRHRSHFYLLCGIILWRSIGFAQTPISLGDSLTLEQVVSLAVEYHPSLRVSKANLSVAEANLTIARANDLPSISATASETHTDGAFLLRPGIAPVSQAYNTYAAGIQAQQTILDFGKMVSRVRANSQLVDATQYSDDSTRAQVIMNVQLAYYTLMQAEQVVTVSLQSIESATQHLKQAQAFYTVGKAAQFDVTKAEVDLSTANVNYITAKNQVQLARLQLDNAMGIRSQRTYKVKRDFEVEAFTFPLDSIKMFTMQHRSDILAANARVEVNNSLVTAAWSQHLPTVSAVGQYNWTNFNFPLLSRWSAGVTVTLPIFLGFSTQAQVDQARAGAEIARGNLDLLQQSVMLEVEQQYLDIKEAEERIVSTDKLVQQAQESLTLAEKQYAAGVGGALEVSDAQLALSNARITRIQALSDYNSSLVRLKKAMGLFK
jgi:outer membrane protein